MYPSDSAKKKDTEKKKRKERTDSIQEKVQNHDNTKQKKESITEVCIFTTGQELNFSYAGVYNLKCVFLLGIDIFKR